MSSLGVLFCKPQHLMACCLHDGKYLYLASWFHQGLCRNLSCWWLLRHLPFVPVLQLLICVRHCAHGPANIKWKSQKLSSSTAVHGQPISTLPLNPCMHLVLDTTLAAWVLYTAMLSVHHSLGRAYASRGIQGQHGASLPAHCQGGALCHGHC